MCMKRVEYWDGKSTIDSMWLQKRKLELKIKIVINLN